MLTLGWFFIPHRAYLKLMGGAQAVGGSTPAGEGASFAWTAGISVGTRWMLGEHTSLGVEAAFEAVQSVSSAPLLNPSATAFRFPAATALMLGVVFGLDFGRMR
jgi:hypothetical protein